MRRFALVALALPLACRDGAPPRGEVVLYVDTDAVVAHAGDPGMVDRVRFEILRDGAPVPGGTRDFLVDEDRFRAHAVSIGLLPDADEAGVEVRVRLFRDDRAHDREPSPGVALDTTVRIPPIAETGIDRLAVFLASDDFGRAVGPIDPSPFDPADSRVGTWSHAGRPTCPTAPRDHEVCVPGGVFFFGDPALRGRTEANDITNERVVVLSPFFLDRAEVTVADFRVVWPMISATAAPPLSWSGNASGDDKADFCSWRDPSASPSADALPLNCVSWDTARAYCRAVGADLPTEAQLEWVLSGMGRESAYPWGEQEPPCAFAVWGRAGVGYYASSPADCRPERSIGGVVSAGGGAKDVIEIGGRVVFDLAGNAAEWTRDLWSRGDEPFWAPLTPMIDPIADYAGSADGDRRPVRGGRWNGGPLSCRAGYRLQNAPTDMSPGIGFRCARDARSR